MDCLFWLEKKDLVFFACQRVPHPREPDSHVEHQEAVKGIQVRRLHQCSVAVGDEEWEVPWVRTSEVVFRLASCLLDSAAGFC